jgi:hypothetical protein
MIALPWSADLDNALLGRELIGLHRLACQSGIYWQVEDVAALLSAQLGIMSLIGATTICRSQRGT